MKSRQRALRFPESLAVRIDAIARAWGCDFSAAARAAMQRGAAAIELDEIRRAIPAPPLPALPPIGSPAAPQEISPPPETPRTDPPRRRVISAGVR